MILEVRDATGRRDLQGARPEADPGGQPAGRVPRHRHPRRQHRPAAEPDLGEGARAPQRARRLAPPGGGQDRDRQRRPRPRDVRLPRPAEDPVAPALAVGVWMGNSDHSNPRSSKPAISLTAAAPLWQAFVRDVSEEMPVAGFPRPEGHRRARRSTRGPAGGPGRGPRATVTEWFIDGTQPGAQARGRPRRAALRPGLRRLAGRPAQGRARADGVGRRRRRLAGRARRGPGVTGRFDSRTAYFWGERSWGGSLVGPCPKPRPEPEEPSDDGGGRGGGRGGGGDDGGGRGGWRRGWRWGRRRRRD